MNKNSITMYLYIFVFDLLEESENCDRLIIKFFNVLCTFVFGCGKYN